MQASIHRVWDRLPDKLILSVFRHCLFNPAIIPPPSHDQRVRLMSTCKKWRALVEFSPSFWDTVVFLPVASENPAHLSRMAQDWLRRTSGVPVSITFDNDFSAYNQGRRATHVEQILYGGGAVCIIQAIIWPCIDRITSLTCALATDQMLIRFFTIPRSSFLSLKHLDIILANRLDQKGPPFDPRRCQTFTVFQNLPLLCDVTVHLLNGLHPYVLGLPWSQLGTLDLGTTPMPPDVFLEIVKTTAHSLNSGCFQVKFTDPSHHQRPPLGTTAAYSMKTLHLIAINPSLDRRMFDVLELPAVLSLTIELEDARNGWDLNHYLPMLEKTPLLESISLIPFTPRIRRKGASKALIQHKIIHSETMDAFFSTIPTIRSLHLSLGLHIHWTTLKKMGCRELLPSLESIECGSVSVSDVLSMVCQRNNPEECFAQRQSVDSASDQLSSQPLETRRAISSLRLLVPEDDFRYIMVEVGRARRRLAATEIFVELSDRRDFYYYNLK